MLLACLVSKTWLSNIVWHLENITYKSNSIRVLLLIVLVFGCGIGVVEILSAITIRQDAINENFFALLEFLLVSQVYHWRNDFSRSCNGDVPYLVLLFLWEANEEETSLREPPISSLWMWNIFNMHYMGWKFILWFIFWQDLLQWKWKQNQSKFKLDYLVNLSYYIWSLIGIKYLTWLPWKINN